MMNLILFMLRNVGKISDSEPDGLGKPFSPGGTCCIEPDGIMLQFSTLFVGTAGWANLQTVIAEYKLCIKFFINSVCTSLSSDNRKKETEMLNGGLLYFCLNKIFRTLGGCIHGVGGVGLHLGEPGGDSGDRGEDGAGGGLRGGRHDGSGRGGGRGSTRVSSGSSSGGSWGGGGHVPRKKNFGHSVPLVGVEVEGKNLLLRLDLADGGGGRHLHDGDVTLIDGHVVEELPLLEAEASLLDSSVLGDLEGVYEDSVVALDFKTEGGGVEDGSVGGSAVGGQESNTKRVSIKTEIFKLKLTHWMTIGLFFLMWRRVGILMSWIGRGKEKTLLKILPTSAMRSSPLVKGFTFLPLTMILLKRTFKNAWLESIFRKLTQQHLFLPGQETAPVSSRHSWPQCRPRPGAWRPDRSQSSASLLRIQRLDGYDSVMNLNRSQEINSESGLIGTRSKFKLHLGSIMAAQMKKMKRTTRTFRLLVRTGWKHRQEEFRIINFFALSSFNFF